MKNKISIIIGLIIGIVIFTLLFFIEPIIHENKCKSRVFEDMQSRASIAEQSVIGIIPENEKDGLKIRNEISSGVIFDRKDNTYYAVTAAHVVENKKNKYKIFTRNTEFKGQTILIDEKTSVTFEIPDDSYYQSLLNGKIEFISDVTDLAIISFETDEELPILEFEDNKIEKGYRIMCIGHPEGNRYNKSYGTIISDLKSVTISSKSTNYKTTDKVYEHNAYMNFGNSGGVAISENTKIAGINTGGAFSITGHFSKGYMIPYDIVQENIAKWKLS